MGLEKTENETMTNDEDLIAAGAKELANLVVTSEAPANDSFQQRVSDRIAYNRTSPSVQFEEARKDMADRLVSLRKSKETVVAAGQEVEKEITSTHLARKSAYEEQIVKLTKFLEEENAAFSKRVSENAKRIADMLEAIDDHIAAAEAFLG